MRPTHTQNYSEKVPTESVPKNKNREQKQNNESKKLNPASYIQGFSKDTEFIRVLIILSQFSFKIFPPNFSSKSKRCSLLFRVLNERLEFFFFTFASFFCFSLCSFPASPCFLEKDAIVGVSVVCGDCLCDSHSLDLLRQARWWLLCLECFFDCPSRRGSISFFSLFFLMKITSEKSFPQGYKFYNIFLTAGLWLTPTDSSTYVQTHWLQMCVPDNLEDPSVAYMYMDGGHNHVFFFLSFSLNPFESSPVFFIPQIFVLSLSQVLQVNLISRSISLA